MWSHDVITEWITKCLKLEYHTQLRACLSQPPLLVLFWTSSKKLKTGTGTILSLSLISLIDFLCEFTVLFYVFDTFHFPWMFQTNFWIVQLLPGSTFSPVSTVYFLYSGKTIHIQFNYILLPSCLWLEFSMDFSVSALLLLMLQSLICVFHVILKFKPSLFSL